MAEWWLCGAHNPLSDEPDNDVHLRDGQVVGTGRAPQDATRLNVQGLWILPVMADLSNRLRSTRQLDHELSAAAKAGFGQVLILPDTQPVLDVPAQVTSFLERARRSFPLDVHVVGAMTRALEGKVLSNMAALKGAGCFGVSQVRYPISSIETLLRSFQYAATHQLMVFIHPEEPSLAQGCVHEGLISTRLGLPGIPSTAETVALAAQLLLVEQTGVRAHVGQVSTAGSVRLLAWAKQEGLPVTADVSIHHLLLTDAAIEGFDAMAHIRPPLRSERDRQSLCAAVDEGIIDAIVSAHEPLEKSAKQAPFAATTPGISAVDGFLSLAMSLVDQRLLALDALIRALSFNPARILSHEIPFLRSGDEASFLLYDTKAMWQLEPASMNSQGHNTPYLHQSLQGQVCQVWLKGQPLLANPSFQQPKVF